MPFYAEQRKKPAKSDDEGHVILEDGLADMTGIRYSLMVYSRAPPKEYISCFF